ncbi:hypothetical protein O6H91_12G048300 [Diphasiastrum complanatum]|uniref:Uncharacterized protein n=5 Tax=Diphasiastrum complanatum TaxID=34168 RepID=A0ACC2C1C3_DIPCM|nr:hypothetical protein O6H91_12G048300 [Diphasiastrum complanatum]KAJ7535842.1 hypothetical protein O6H91_12G048300 [Diphasiastrum complanatum]KAJ7535843.1 hypothetical protein O6H91_12G048300 [Diphasiastrum complanatum]KAJ7535844.1 hypothetical protein O6H91_12G048300 [Diphasiastrum complanatum]KAJ7535845.1 hypothetical protein O6H91_12G048300 [Diphasiastrum complanatum]
MATMAMQMPTMAPSAPTPSPLLRANSPASLQSPNLSSPTHPSQGLGASSLGGGPGASHLPRGPPLLPPFSLTSSLSVTPSPGVAIPLSSYSPPVETAIGLSRVKLADILPEDGAPSDSYTRAVETLSGSLARVNAAIVELSAEDAALVRCALESAKLYFQTRSQTNGVAQTWASRDGCSLSGYFAGPVKDTYVFRAGRSSSNDSVEPPPPCMPDLFRCLGKASRAALSAIARSLRLRGDVFNPLLDDSPLPHGDLSYSVLAATAYHTCNPKGNIVEGPGAVQEVEKGLLMLIASDSAGLQVCDPSGRWYLADTGVNFGDLLLLTGRALQQATAGLRRACSYRVIPPSSSSLLTAAGRTSLAFRLMPRGNATIDCSAMSDAGHAIPEGYGPVSVNQFMDGLTAAEALMGNGFDNNLENVLTNSEPSLRSVLCDPLTRSFLEDAVVAHCGHSFGGATLRRVLESRVCSTCGVGVEPSSFIPNFALRAAATAYKYEEQNRSILGTKLKRKDLGDYGDFRNKRPNKDNAASPGNKDSAPRTGKGVQYPFVINERVMIKGNKRTPEKFVGREASITSLCLNGWYLVRTLDSGDSVRLQYRSLQKIRSDENGLPEHHRQGSHT